jgi:hypothetical protein
VRAFENQRRRERILRLDPLITTENRERNAQRMRLMREVELYRANER